MTLPQLQTNVLLQLRRDSSARARMTIAIAAPAQRFYRPKSWGMDTNAPGARGCRILSERKASEP